ncbi:hypothetical protein [Shouchella clausii]|uniref:hypothetical protein n=1 Tax=Shouchella clausii TaxID=79880 RepID=UPI0031844E34
MNRKWKILMASFYFWYKAQQEKDAEAKYALLEEYNYAGGTLHMEANTSEYEQTGDAHDIELTPTDLTYELLQRWEAITEVIPTIDYPEEAIELEDWLNVYNTLADNRFEAMERQKKLLKEKSMDPRIQWSLMITSM